MKSFVVQSIVLPIFLLIVSELHSAPIDFSEFIADEGVIADQTLQTVLFTEDFANIVWRFTNHDFLVGDNATVLSFDYILTFGSNDIGDYFTFFLNDAYNPLLRVNFPSTGHYEIDLSPYRGSVISLSWVLFWGGNFDDTCTASAQISEMDLAMETIQNHVPAPEPSTLTFLGCGLIFLYGIRIRNDLKLSND